MNQETADQVIALLMIGLALFIIFQSGEYLLRSRKQKEAEPITPVTEEGLKQFDQLPSAMAVLLAWSDAGNNPRHHRKMQDEVRSKMPVLARALDRMVDTNS